MTTSSERSAELAGVDRLSSSSLRHMRAVELRSYKAAWRASYSLKRQWTKAISERKVRSETAAGLRPLAQSMPFSERTESDSDSERPASPNPLRASSVWNAATIAARLLLARLFDQRPCLLESIRTAAAIVVLIDVPQIEWMQSIASVWPNIIFDDKARLIHLDAPYSGDGCDAFYLVAETPPTKKEKDRRQKAALRALSIPVPLIAISAAGVTCLPDAILKSATERLVFPPLDPTAITRSIRVVTGTKCRSTVDAGLAAKLTATDLVIAVRFGRSPEECIAGLKRLAALKDTTKESRDIALCDLHGLGEAKAWAESAILDIAAWKRGEIAWSAVPSAIALTGPPGTGKTLFAKSFASEVGFNLITATYAKWQSSGEGHLGDLLRAMRDDFNTARAQAPSVLFIDEVDSFPDRSRLSHAYRTYTTDVVNALLEQLDGMAGREGVIVIGASNDLTRCDPALLRAGRFDKIVQIGFPNLDELEKMFRVRLSGELISENIRPIAELALGMTGADVELTVKEAKRTARQAGRCLTLPDLQGAITLDDGRPPEQTWRACVHEASHIVVDVIHFGPDDVFATVVSTRDRPGASIRTQIKQLAGTYENYRKRLEVILAGRVGEDLLLGAASHGAGGSAGSDLERATKLAADMIASLGLLGPASLTYYGPRGTTSDFLRFGEVRAAVAKELLSAEQSCRALLESRRDILDAVAHLLLAARRVDGCEVQALLAKHASANAGSEWQE